MKHIQIPMKMKYRENCAMLWNPQKQNKFFKKVIIQHLLNSKKKRRKFVPDIKMDLALSLGLITTDGTNDFLLGYKKDSNYTI